MKMKLYMTDKQAEWLQSGLVIIGTTLLAFLLATFIISDFTSISIFAPMEKKVDFQLSDIYNAVDEKRATKPLSQEVIIVAVDSCDREGTLDVIDRVASLGPKAIGLDISFQVPKEEEDNDRLVATLTLTDNLVVPTSVKQEKDLYRREYLSFFEGYEDFAPEHIGYANLDANQMWGVIRTFVPFVHLNGSDTIMPYMAVELASIACPERAQQLLERNNEAEIIDFTSTEIKIMQAHDLDDPAEQEYISGKVVMIGDLSDTKDTYLTPLHEPQPGVIIHAYALQTILSGRYIAESSTWLNWLIAVVLCITLISLLLFAKRHMSNIGNLLIRVSQFAIMYCLVWIGCSIYAGYHIYMDFTPAIVMLGIGALAFDVSFAIYGIIVYLIRTTHKIKQSS